LIVIGECNATNDPKDLEGRVGDNTPPTNQELPYISSLSGTGRIAITIVVPPKWYYEIAVKSKGTSGKFERRVPDKGSCSASSWEIKP
jgi:hypothetical protein